MVESYVVVTLWLRGGYVVESYVVVTLWLRGGYVVESYVVVTLWLRGGYVVESYVVETACVGRYHPPKRFSDLGTPGMGDAHGCVLL